MMQMRRALLFTTTTTKCNTNAQVNSLTTMMSNLRPFHSTTATCNTEQSQQQQQPQQRTGKDNKLKMKRSILEESQNHNEDIDLTTEMPRVHEGQFEPSRHHVKHAQKSPDDKESRFMYPMRLDRHDNPVFNYSKFTAYNKARYPAIETNKVVIPKKPRHPYSPPTLDQVDKLMEFRKGVDSDDLIASRASPLVRQVLSWNNASQPELNSRAKQIAVKRFQLHPSDHGSAPVQIAVMTERIKYLTSHMQVHKQDKYTARRLQILMNKRKRMMQYLRKRNPEQYWKVMRGLDVKVKQQMSAF